MGVPSIRHMIALEDLTPRQREVAELVAQRLSGPEIAEKLNRDVRTVYSHILVIAGRIEDSGYDAPRRGVWLIRKWMAEQRRAA